jgi:hypothetical protein
MIPALTESMQRSHQDLQEEDTGYSFPIAAIDAHPVPCSRCAERKMRCYGPEGKTCEPCQVAKQKCSMSTGRGKGKGKAEPAGECVGLSCRAVDLTSSIGSASYPSDQGRSLNSCAFVGYRWRVRSGDLRNEGRARGGHHKASQSC